MFIYNKLHFFKANLNLMMVVLGSGIGNWGWYHQFGGSGNDYFSWSWGWVNRVSAPFDDGIETIVWVSGVVDSPGGTVSFGQRVRALDYVTFTDFVLAFVVTSVGVLDTVVVFVFGWGVVVLVFRGVGDGGSMDNRGRVDNGSGMNSGGGVRDRGGIGERSSVGGYQRRGDRGVRSGMTVVIHKTGLGGGYKSSNG